MKTIKTLAMAVVLSACSPVMPVIDGGDASVVNDMPTVSDVGGEDASRDPMLVGTWQWELLQMPTGTITSRIQFFADGTGNMQYSAFSGSCPFVRTASREFRWANQSNVSLRIDWIGQCAGGLRDADGGVVQDGGSCFIPCDVLQLMGERVVDYSFDGMGRLNMRLSNEEVTPYTRVR